MIVIRVSSNRRQYHQQQTMQRKNHENSKRLHIQKREDSLKLARQYHLKFKLRAYATIGNGSIKCVECGLSDHRYLEVDHINGWADSDIEINRYRSKALYICANNNPKQAKEHCPLL